MKTIIKESARVFGTHLVFMLVAVLFLPAFGWLIGSNWGAKLYSTVTALLSLSAVYNSIWQAGRQEMRRIKSYNKQLAEGQNPITPNIWKGLIIGLVGSIPSIIALGVYVYAFLQGTESAIYFSVNMGYRIYQSAFVGFLGNDNLTYIWNCVAVTCIVPLLSPIAYFAGTKQFLLLEKILPRIVYKKREPKKDATRP